MPGPFSPEDRENPDITGIRTKANSLKAKFEAARVELTKKRHAGAVEPTGPAKLSRSEGFWPFLLIRSFPGDIGARPAQVTTMDHSPDIILIKQDPAYTPTVVTRDGMAELLRRNWIIWPGWKIDVWVHVWNLGRAPAHGVRVRAWAIDPAGGKEFIGGRQLDLGDRASSNSHLAVRIGTWTARPIAGAGRQREIVATVECISDVATAATQDRHTARRMTVMQGPDY